MLDNRADVSGDELAHLEFLYLSALDYERHGIPNLERQIAETAGAVRAGSAFDLQAQGRRRGPEWHIANEEVRGNAATQGQA